MHYSNFLLQSGNSSYQGAAAEKDHEDDERLKPAVLHNLVAGLPGPPPHQAQSGRRVHLAAAAAAGTHCQRETRTSTRRNTSYQFSRGLLAASKKCVFNGMRRRKRGRGWTRAG